MDLLIHLDERMLSFPPLIVHQQVIKRLIEQYLRMLLLPGLAALRMDLDASRSTAYVAGVGQILTACL